MKKPRVFVCVNVRNDGDNSCGTRGSLRLADILDARGEGRVDVRRRACMGLCAFGPNVRRDGTGVHVRVSEADLDGIIDGTKKSNIGTISQETATRK